MIKYKNIDYPLPIYELQRGEVDLSKIHPRETNAIIIKNNIAYKLSKTILADTLVKFDEFDMNLLGEDANFEDFSLMDFKISDKKLTNSLIKKVMKFFREVYLRDNAEAAVLLMFNPDAQARWKVFIPIQVNATNSSVNYAIPHDKDYKHMDLIKDNPEALALYEKAEQEFDQLLEEGYTLAGTIHSHCDFGAFHSGVDDADEINFNGIHLTFGNVDKRFSYSGRFIMDKNETDLPLEGISKIDNLFELLPIESVKVDLSNVLRLGDTPPSEDLDLSDIPSLLIESQAIRIEDSESGEAIWISEDDFKTHKAKFQDSRFTIEEIDLGKDDDDDDDKDEDKDDDDDRDPRVRRSEVVGMNEPYYFDRFGRHNNGRGFNAY